MKFADVWLFVAGVASVVTLSLLLLAAFVSPPRSR